MEGFIGSSFSSTLLLLLLLLAVIACQLPDLEAAGGGRKPGWDPLIRRPVDQDDESPEDETQGTRWAVLVAGSKGYGNYRHQADVCHAYQILKKGGLKDENIVVFMYDDIAHNLLNPRKGVIINHPNGTDVYAGVPKDYTGDQVTAANLYAVLLGNKEGVKGGSGKVVDSKADDRIFIYYADHGGPGVLGMPNLPHLYANDFIDLLKKKHSAGTYKEMVIYVEACESGSFFEGIMPEDLNIYVTTASNAEESSWGTYCPGSEPEAPPEYITCLGDLYSVAWMEDSESHNLKKETIEQQYENVKLRTSNDNDFESGSHVMEYGSKDIKPEKLYFYQGFDPASINFPGNQIGLTQKGVVNQRDADLLFMWERYKRMGDNAASKAKLLKEITDTMLNRQHLDASIDNIGVHLFGPENGPNILKSVRKPGLALVDDWQCLKSMVRVFETHCGSLGQYGMKHMRAFANICNSNISQAAMEEASKNTCSQMKTVQYTHPNQVYSA